MKKYCCIILSVFLLVFLVSCSAHDDEKGADTEYLGEYNTDIKTDKVNGYMSTMGETFGETLDQFIDMSEVIFVGEVVSDGEAYSESIDYTAFGKDESLNFALTKISVKIDEVLYGTINDEVITFVQVGAPGSDEMVKQIKKGDNVVIIGSYDEDKDYYCSVCFENAIFYITENGLYTYSNKADMGKYDGTPLELLKRDIANIIEENNMTPENNLYARSASENEAE